MSLFEKILNRVVGIIGWPLGGTGVAYLVGARSDTAYIVAAVVGLIPGILVPLWIEKDEEPNA